MKSRPSINAVQPYFAAYMRAHRMTEAPAPPHHEYLFWIQAQWREWRELNGFRPEQPLSEEQRKKFGRWLAKRWGRKADA